MRGRKLLRKIAECFVVECQLTPADLNDPQGLFSGAPRIRAMAFESVWGWVKNADPRTLGDLAFCGRATPSQEGGTGLYQVHCGNLPEKFASGKAVLRHLTANAIIAEVVDILWEQNAAETTYDDVNEHTAEELCDEVDVQGLAESSGSAGTFNDPNVDMPSDEEMEKFFAEEAARRAEIAEEVDDDDADLHGTQDWSPSSN